MKTLLGSLNTYARFVRVVTVPIGESPYDIQIGSGLLSSLGKECAKLSLGRVCAIISDVRVAPRYGSRVKKNLERFGFRPVLLRVAAGEKAKSLKTVEWCYNQLAVHKLERKSFIVALGGGVVGDLAGFVAASYLRGIPFVQVPTTLLAQVDSSVGGKVGVNLMAGKNMVGAFYQPRIVCCDLDTLKTLPEREFRAGLAEVIKYGIIYDASLFETLERDLPRILRRDSKTMASIIARCCEIKADVVRQDEKENGLRAILNFGHTVGHALEAISNYGKYLHGEAISIGQVIAARLSGKVTGLPASEVDRIERLFKGSGLPTAVKLSAVEQRKLFDAIKLDKKVKDGQVRFVLARQIGQVEFGLTVNQSLIERALAT